MRLWSLCPSLLDRKGLGGVWVEGLLCQAVLAGKTKGYTHHPQLARWRACPAPLEAIGVYLSVLQREATSRGYNYNAGLIIHPPPSLLTAAADHNDDDAEVYMAAVAQALPPLIPTPPLIEVTEGQCQYELQVQPSEGARDMVDGSISKSHRHYYTDTHTPNQPPQHLLKKLQQRDPVHCARVQALLAADGGGASAVPIHPCFRLVPGPVVDWDVVKEEGSTKKKPAKGGKAKGKASKPKAPAIAAAAAAAAAAAEEDETGAATAVPVGTTKRATRSSSSNNNNSGSTLRSIPIAEMDRAGASGGGKRRRSGRLRSRSEDMEDGGDDAPPTAAVAVAVGQKRKRYPSDAAAVGNSTAMATTTTATAAMLMVVQEEGQDVEGRDQDEDQKQPPARRTSSRRHIDVK